MLNLLDENRGMVTPTKTAQGMLIRVTGTPNRTYTLERASGASGPWQTLTNLVTSPDGTVDYEDTTSASGAFYRTTSSPTSAAAAAFTPAIYVDYKRCIGCNACSLACKQENNFENSPAVVANTGKYVGLGQRWNEVYHYEDGTYPAVNAQVFALTFEQCTMCAHRLAVGQLPACVITCMGITREFGDYNALRLKYPDSYHMGDGLHQKVRYGNLLGEPSLEQNPPPASGYIPANDCRQCHK